jgi:hypothetical protein
VGLGVPAQGGARRGQPVGEAPLAVVGRRRHGDGRRRGGGDQRLVLYLGAQGGGVDHHDPDGAVGAGRDAGRLLARTEAVAAHVALADHAPGRVEPGDLVGAGPRAVAAAEAPALDVGDDPVEGVLLVGVGGAAVQAGRVGAVVAGRGHRLLERLHGGAALQQADGAVGLAVVQPVHVVAGGDAGLAAGAGVEVDVEGVLLAGKRLGERDAVLPYPPIGDLAEREAFDGGQVRLLGEVALERRGAHGPATCTMPSTTRTA